MEFLTKLMCDLLFKKYLAFFNQLFIIISKSINSKYCCSFILIL